MPMIPRPRLRPIARSRRRAGDPREVAEDRAPRRGRNAQQPRRRVRYPRPPRGGAQDLWPGARRRVTELSRWGRSTQDLVQTLDDLHGWKVSVLAEAGLSFDLSTASGKLMRTIMAGLAEFERDLIRDRVKSGLAAAKARGVKLGRQIGQRPSDGKAKRVLGMHADGLSYRLIARNVGLSKNTVMDIVKRGAVA